MADDWVTIGGAPAATEAAPVAAAPAQDDWAPVGQSPTAATTAAPAGYGGKLAAMWEHPPAGPSVIGTLRGLWDAVLTPGRTVQAANDQAKKTQITDSDIPLSTATMAGPAMNMAANIALPAPGISADLARFFTKAPEGPVMTSAQRKAASIVSAPLKERGLSSPEAVKTALGGLGPEAVLADADPRLAQMAGTIAAKPGQGQQILRDALEARNAGASDRIISTTDKVMGAPVDLAALSDKIHTDAKNAAGPLWQKAYASPLDATPELTEALKTPLAKTALAKAATLAKSDINGPQTSMFDPQPAAPPLPDWAQSVMAKGGDAADKLKAALQASGAMPAEGPQVDARGLHLTRQALDDMISQSQRAGANNKVRILNGIRGQIDGTLKSIPEFAQADKIYADKSRIQEAMDAGVNIFKNSNTPEDVTSLLGGMSDAERNGYQQGARVAVRNVMGTARNDASAARGLFAKGFNQEKLASVLGPDEADTLLGRVNAENTYAGTDNRVLRGSPTADRLYGAQSLDDAHGFPDILSTINYSSLHALPRHFALRALSGVLNHLATGRQQAVEQEVARLLTSRGGSLQPGMFQAPVNPPRGLLSAAPVPLASQQGVAGLLGSR